MAVSIICRNKDPGPWVEALRSLDPELDMRVWPEDGDRSEVDMVLCWMHPEGELLHYPNLRCVCSMGAGVDHFLLDRQFPQQPQVVRIVDPGLAQSMFEYICACALFFFRDLDQYAAQQDAGRWRQLPPRRMAEHVIGVMGLGELGASVAQRLQATGFAVRGWSRTAKQLDYIECFAGADGLPGFLAGTDTLVCLLPLTEQTTGILNADLFRQLPAGASLINVARGEHLVESDLLASLEAGHLRGAYLDVFAEEPLPSPHPFWQHPRVYLTPHSSSITDPEAVAPQVLENYRRVKSGEALLHEVDLSRGY